MVLLFLKEKFSKKNEIIMMSYNLKEMVNIPSKLKLKIIFCDIDLKTGSMDINQLKKKINKKTLCVVLTNIFSDYNSCNKIKLICKSKKIPIIEDNAIYFDNYVKKKKNIFSGSFGDYSLLSFNVMKNISGLYGGCVSHNNKEFDDYSKGLLNNSKFPNLLYARQIVIFFILKLFSISFFYRNLIHYLLYFSSEYKIRFIQNLIYPSLRFRNIRIPPYYLSKINLFTKKIIYFQLKDFNKRKQNHSIRKINNKLYYDKFREINSKYIHVFSLKDLNFQNYLEFPVLLKNKVKISKYLMKKGFDLKKVHYFNCSKTFNSKFKCKNSERVENEIMCLPNHEKINKVYIKRLINEIQIFYNSN